MNISEIMKELNRLINEKYTDFKGSYLYGSRANGNTKEDSDIDIIALFDEVNRDKEMEIYGLVCDLDYKYGVFISLMPYTSEDLEMNHIFYNEVVNKGIFYAPA
ncbi:MAG: nucleotidyltransferase domain-containing protein [Cyanobacteriota bacterium]